jgi:hypothetical protein
MSLNAKAEGEIPAFILLFTRAVNSQELIAF